MPITPDQVRLYASERLTDFADGGGAMSPNVIVDGEDNNLFDDISDFDRVASKVSIRKLFGQVTSLNADKLLSAFLFLDSRPEDPATDALIFAYGGYTTEREEAQAALAESNVYLRSTTADAVGGTATAGSAVITGLTIADTTVFDGAAARRWAVVQIGSRGYLRRVVSRASGDVTVNSAIPISSIAGGAQVWFTADVDDRSGDILPGVRAYGVAHLTSAAAEEALGLAIDTPWVNAVGVADGTAMPTEVDGWEFATAVEGFPGYSIAQSRGRIGVFGANDIVLLHHTTSTAPAAAANGGTVNVGRTNLARLEVIGSDGTVHARFDARAPAPAGVGCTADLAAGTVTFSDVSGFAQPVTVRHRIEELNRVTEVGLTTLALSRPLGREFPAGAKVSSLLRFGDLQGRVEGAFAQTAWTGVWSNSVIGGTPLADFNDTVYPITCLNAGAINERWALIFTNTTTFRCVGEGVGEVATGNVGADFAPINPSTGQPYFTIPSAGWGLGWAAGNVLRFNTRGANASAWALRSVQPSEPAGDDKVVVEFRGYANE